ncbi:MAG: hypothetical protein KGM49_12130 [Sphingomonadales bacterium]|nr:hypothetical protein [Sphingomonadales bacterium]
MAHKGIGFFDSRGHFFKSPEEATVSDLSMLLGRIGEGESLAPGIANLLLERRGELERIFTEHDELKAEQALARANGMAAGNNVTSLAEKLNTKSN